MMMRRRTTHHLHVRARAPVASAWQPLRRRIQAEHSARGALCIRAAGASLRAATRKVATVCFALFRRPPGGFRRLRCAFRAAACCRTCRLLGGSRARRALARAAPAQACAPSHVGATCVAFLRTVRALRPAPPIAPAAHCSGKRGGQHARACAGGARRRASAVPITRSALYAAALGSRAAGALAGPCSRRRPGTQPTLAAAHSWTHFTPFSGRSLAGARRGADGHAHGDEPPRGAAAPPRQQAAHATPPARRACACSGLSLAIR